MTPIGRNSIVENNLVGPSRPSEGPIWKYLRLVPLIITIGVVVGAWSVMADNQKDLKDALKITKERVEINREAIELLKGQSIRVEEQMKRVDEKLGEQKDDIKDILTILRSQ